MANWTGAILTNKGRALAAKVEAGTCKLELTKLKVGDGTPSDLESMTDLASPKQNIGISSITPSETGECDIECVITNKDMDRGFYMREMGIFATDPDEGEILYAVQTDTHPDYLQGKGTSATLSIALHVTIAITNTDSVTAVINPAGLLTSADLDKHNTSDDAHSNLFKLFAKLTDLKTHNEAADAHENRFKLFEKIENLGDDIVKKLALTTTISAVTALQTNSWFGQLLKLVLTASGVKYSIATNGYVCLGEFFGGLIIQWGVSKTGIVTTPISYTTGLQAVATWNDNTKEDHPNQVVGAKINNNQSLEITAWDIKANASIGARWILLCMI
jgi:hypothetical protein|nr:MAG TPA: tail collar fiber protein [Caudoviricetes sp.]